MSGASAFMTAIRQNEVRALDDRSESSNRLEFAMLYTGTLLVLIAITLAVVLH
jgi:hypothetical protein